MFSEAKVVEIYCIVDDLIEELPVLETEVIELSGVDLSLYRRIGER